MISTIFSKEVLGSQLEMRQQYTPDMPSEDTFSNMQASGL
jgi:hypothetical protein